MLALATRCAQVLRQACALWRGVVGIVALLLICPDVASAQQAEPGSVVQTSGCGCSASCVEDSPGYRAFCDACDIPYPQHLKEPSAVKPTPFDEGITPDEFPQPDGLTPLNSGAAPGAETPIDLDTAGAAPLPTLAATGIGATAASRSAVPSMVGDFFNVGFTFGEAFDAFAPGVVGASLAIGGGDRFFKFSENNSPFPQDRVYFGYNFFANPVQAIGGPDSVPTNLSRFTFGVEKTFYQDLLSVELRTPLAAGLESSQVVDGDNEGVEFGNLSLILKGLLWRNESISVGGGLGIILPTGSDSEVIDTGGELLISAENETLFLQPFLGIAATPNDRFFQQFFVQVNFDTNGTDVFAPAGTALNTSVTGVAETISTQTLLFLDYSAGYWIYRPPGGCRRCQRGITGVASMFELHYSTALEGQDVGVFGGGAAAAGVFSSTDAVLDTNDAVDALNITGAVLFEINGETNLRVFGSAPLREGADSLFDAEFGLQLVHRY